MDKFIAVSFICMAAAGVAMSAMLLFAPPEPVVVKVQDPACVSALARVKFYDEHPKLNQEVQDVGE